MTGQTGLTSSAIRKQLEDQIAAGELPLGAKLPSERELAENFGVSRPLVREVLSGLAQRGLVEIHPARGTFVRRSLPSDATGPFGDLIRGQGVTVRELVVARSMLECQAASLAAERADPVAIEAILSAVAKYDEAEHLIERSIADVVFHSTIAKASGNFVITMMFNAIAMPTFEMMLRSHSDHRISRTGGTHHRKIADAIAAGDAATAQQAVVTHLHVGDPFLSADYERDVKSLATQVLSRLLGPDVRPEDWLAAVIQGNLEGTR